MNFTEKDITGVVVNYCTPVEINNAVTSLIKHHKEMPIIIFDASPYRSPGQQMCAKLASQYANVTHLHTGKNIGHGPGLDMAIKLVDTRLILIFDSDIVVNETPINEMLSVMNENDIYGCGAVLTTNSTGVNAATGIDYLHPYFALIDKAKYLKYRPFVNHGAPLIATMNQLHEKGVKVANVELKGYVHHIGRVTRRLKPKEFKPGNWERRVT